MLLALVSLLLILVSGDSLSGVFAVLIIQPWGTVLVWVMDGSGLDSVLINILFMLGGAILNAWCIYKLLSWLMGRRGGA
jgi:hypothetical protein